MLEKLKRVFSAVCLSALLVQQTEAATFSVSNNTDMSGSGSGSLRQAIADSNAAGGANTISWTTGSGGTLTLGSDLPGILANTTLDVSSAPSAVTIAGTNAVPIAGAVTFNNNSVPQVWGISAVISGSGRLIKNGAGNLSLTGNNTYSGGTLINNGILSISSDAALGSAAGVVTFNGGTLQTAAGIVSARNMIVNAGGATIDTAGSSSTIIGVLGGVGDLNVNGGGTLSLNGANYYSGGTVINATTLVINSDAALGYGYGALTFNGGTLRIQDAYAVTDPRNIVLNAGGGTFDTAGSTSTTLFGIISGAGMLTKISSGTLVLFSANTYSGGTTVQGGTLNINNDNNLGAVGGALSLDGGTLQTASAITSARRITLGTGGGTFDTNGFNASLSGIIGGAGGLTKVGYGTLNLSGANTYTGGTTINLGTLQLGADNVLPLNGPLAVAGGATFNLNGFNQSQSVGPVTNNGLINAGAGALTMNNGYSGQGTLAVTLQSGAPSITSSGNNIDLTGGTLAVKLANPLVIAGQTFTPIAGVSAGTALPIVASPAALTFIPSVSGNNVVLTVKLVPFASIAASGNQSAVGIGLEPLRAVPTGDVATMLGSLYGLGSLELRAALDQIGPISLASMRGIGMASSNVQSAAVSQRMTVLAQGTGRGGFSTYSVNGRSSYPGTLVASAGEAGSLAQGGPKNWDSGSSSPWGFFTAGIATDGRLMEANSSWGLQPGYAFNTGGITAGADYRINDNLAAGISSGYLHGHASIYTPASGTVDSQSARYGVYATGFSDDFHANVYAGGAQDFFTTRRGILFGTIARTATAGPRGDEVNLAASAGYDVTTAHSRVFSPFFGFNYDRLMIERFTEDGAGILNLNVGPQTAESLRSSLGLRYSEKFNTDPNMFTHSCTPYISLAWRHEFFNQSQPIQAQLASGAGNAFSVATGNFARDGTLLGTGISVDLTEQTLAKVDYSGDFRSHYVDNTFNASLRFKF